MLIYFHKNKLRYEKGQLAPFFILILVVLIMMAMVTVNLSKVAFIKTDSSNAVDSGSLAAGSLMANLFNAVAKSNYAMEQDWLGFYVPVIISFVLALVPLTMAYTSLTTAQASYTAAVGSLQRACSLVGCCFVVKPTCCVTYYSACSAAGTALAAGIAANATALTQLTTFIRSAGGLILAIASFTITQYLLYRNIRKMADSEEVDEKGNVIGWRQRAINLGHRFAFINSGIGSKLKEGSPPPSFTDLDKMNNFRNEFSQFLDNLSYIAEYTYPWEDEKGREHYVRVKVDIDPVDTFDLQVALLPLAVELAPLVRSVFLAISAQTSISDSTRFAGSASGSACTSPCSAISSTQSAIYKNTSALASMASIFPLLAFALAGLSPVRRITDSNGLSINNLPDLINPPIICWINDIMDHNNPEAPHNRLVRVETTQHHQGADLGLWQTKYPDTNSYSLVDFSGEGKGKIRVQSEEDLRHDPSIIDTDTIGSGAP